MSEGKINMSLDQIIQKNKPSSRGRGGQRGGRGNMRGASRGIIRGASRGNPHGGFRGNMRGGRGMRKLSNQNISRRLDNNRNFTNNRGQKLMTRRRPRFGSERRIIENNAPRNNMNNKVNLFSLFANKN
jgi:hypothetical protein